MNRNQPEVKLDTSKTIADLAKKLNCSISDIDIETLLKCAYTGKVKTTHGLLAALKDPFLKNFRGIYVFWYKDHFYVGKTSKNFLSRLLCHIASIKVWEKYSTRKKKEKQKHQKANEFIEKNGLNPEDFSITFLYVESFRSGKSNYEHDLLNSAKESIPYHFLRNSSFIPLNNVVPSGKPNYPNAREKLAKIKKFSKNTETLRGNNNRSIKQSFDVSRASQRAKYSEDFLIETEIDKNMPINQLSLNELLNAAENFTKNKSQNKSVQSDVRSALLALAMVIDITNEKNQSFPLLVGGSVFLALYDVFYKNTKSANNLMDFKRTFFSVAMNTIKSVFHISFEKDPGEKENAKNAKVLEVFNTLKAYDFLKVAREKDLFSDELEAAENSAVNFSAFNKISKTSGAHKIKKSDSYRNSRKNHDGDIPLIQ